MRIPTLLLLAVILGAGEAEAALARLDAGLVGLAGELTALGLPDVRGAVLFRGELKLVGDKGAIAASRARGIEASSYTSGGEQESLNWHGFHLRLRDGTWLAGLDQRLIPADGRIDTDDLSEIAAGTSPVLPAGEAEDDGDGRPALAAPDQALVAASASARPLWRELRRSAGGQQAARSILLLVRWGLPGAGRLAVLHAAERMGGARTPETLVLFEPDAQAGWYEAGEAPVVVAAPSSRPLPDPLALVRTGMGRWALDALVAGDAGAAAIARACLPADGPRIAGLTARLALPAEVPAAAPLARRLTVWSSGDGGWGSDQPVLLDSRLEGQEGDEAEGRRLRQRQGWQRIAPGWDDLPALLALAGDRSPSRWVVRDPVDGTPRAASIGDNALRAVAVLLGCDPRRLVGIDPAQAWDDAARDAAATAIRGWWQAHGGSARPQVLGEVARALPWGRLPAFIAGPGERAPRVAPVVERLRGPAPPAVGERVLAALLAATLIEPAMEPVVAAWPIAGDARLVLAAWHRIKGRGGPLEAELAESLGGDLTVPAAYRRAQAALHACRALPTPPMDGLLAAALAGSADRVVVRLVACTAIDAFSLHRGCWFGDPDPLEPLLQAARTGREEGTRPLDLAIWLRCLDDRRLLAGAPVSSEGSGTIGWGGEWIRHEPGGWGFGERPAPPLAVRADWRICDLAAHVALGMQVHLGLGFEAGEGARFDPAAAPAQRDQGIAAIRERLLPAARAVLAKQGWAMPVPAQAADPQALY